MDEVVKVVSEMYPSIVGKYLHSVSHVSQYLMPWISRNFYNQLCDQHQPEVSKYFLDTLDIALIHPPWSPMVTLVTQWRIIQSMKTRTLQLARQENRKFIFTTNSSWSCEVHHLILSAINLARHVSAQCRVSLPSSVLFSECPEAAEEEDPGLLPLTLNSLPTWAS